MTKEQHTPGPWKVGEKFNSFIWVDEVTEDFAENICAVMNEHEANAHLIAAAPDLLESLEDAVILLEAQDPPFEMNLAKKAIAKARNGGKK